MQEFILHYSLNLATLGRNLVLGPQHLVSQVGHQLHKVAACQHPTECGIPRSHSALSCNQWNSVPQVTVGCTDWWREQGSPPKGTRIVGVQRF